MNNIKLRKISRNNCNQQKNKIQNTNQTKLNIYIFLVDTQLFFPLNAFQNWEQQKNMGTNKNMINEITNDTTWIDKT